ncbi:MAG: metallo-mystery pair system four-Cys motif protein [Candidatus Sericytochromatia bacterium]
MIKKIAIFSLAAFMLGCNTPNNSNNNSEKIDLKIKFKAKANGQDVECGKTYENIGTTKSKVNITDFRFYIHDVKLVDEKGKETKLDLTQDKKWQDGNVALLDFENKSGDCSSGTTEINKEISGSIAKGLYKGIKFTVGVPFDKNHQDVTKANSPLNLTSMFWVWNSGYKFMRLDLKTTGLPQGYFLHLGSTGCMVDTAKTMSIKHEGEDHAATSMSANANVPPSMCKNPNRPEISLTDFNYEKDSITLDLDALFSNSNVDTNQDKSPSGCMSTPDDQDCKTIFNNLGLDFGDSKTSGQKLFKVEK